ncbi:MAG: hypothetical protein JW836_14440 [Deltaproteobacteria bacterium]|nr:hypothetical protein [Deltaproteobacteria bacterium]
MQSENIAHFIWPEISNTVSIVALALALAVFIFGAFSGVLANKLRIIFAVCLSTLIGWFTMPLAVKAASALHIMGTKTGVVILVTAIMFLVAVVATSIYEIITVTFPDIGMASKK